MATGTGRTRGRGEQRRGRSAQVGRAARDDAVGDRNRMQGKKKNNCVALDVPGNGMRVDDLRGSYSLTTARRADAVQRREKKRRPASRTPKNKVSCAPG